MSNTDIVTACICGVLNVLMTVASHHMISNMMVTPVSPSAITTTIVDK